MASARRISRGTTLGGLAFASFVIAAASGVVLALPFDVQAPYESVALLLLTNPGARFYRNVHYFAAQVFLVLTVLHTWEHLTRGTERRLSASMWIRLAFALPLTGFLMLSGFILKGDAESVQALRIVSTAVGNVPLAGRHLATLLFGASPSLQVVYVHHVATATLIVWALVAEHARSIWPKLRAIVGVGAAVALVGSFLSPTLHDGLDAVVRGPWYFLGLQELLHWLSHAGWAIVVVAVPLLVLIVLPRLAPPSAGRAKKFLAATLLAYGGLTLFALVLRGENWALRAPRGGRDLGLAFAPAFVPVPPDAMRPGAVPVALGRPEGCLFCHRDTRGISASHRPDAVGCASCHGGDPFTLDKAMAHRGILLVPGNLDVADRTCGLPACHPTVVDRVRRSIMTTMSGVVSVDRSLFGERGPVLANVRDLGRSPADTHLRQLCASCHVGADKHELGPTGESGRGGGCNACHLKYTDAAKEALGRYQRERPTPSASVAGLVHPDVSISIGGEPCFGCHSRSGRISTNYEGWQEVAPNGTDERRAIALPRRSAEALNGTKAGEARWARETGEPGAAGGAGRPGEAFRAAVPGTPRTRTLEDGRVFTFVKADVHFERGMVCVDCHTAREVMGDGTAHARKNQQVRIACEDCHSAGTRMVPADRADSESRRILQLRATGAEAGTPGTPLAHTSVAGTLVATRTGDDLFVNTFVDAAGKPRLRTKLSRRLLALNAPAAACGAGRGHARLSCESCHTAWAPRCAGCHTSFNHAVSAYDHVSGVDVRGAWGEAGSDYRAEPPTLGLRSVAQKNGQRAEVVDTFAPGMVLTIDRGASGQAAAGDKEDRRLPAGGQMFARLYARVSPHTVSREGRSCESCHNDPIALGYGRGTLRYEVSDARAVPHRRGSADRTTNAVPGLEGRPNASMSARVGRWSFTAAREASPYDRLPMDAWIGFLQPARGRFSTRDDVRPFTVEEQKRILTVGACLTCHEGDSEPMRKALEDFAATLKQTNRKCALPAWGPETGDHRDRSSKD